MSRKNWIVLTIITSIWIVGAAGFYLETRKLEGVFLSINAFGVLVAVYVSVLNSLHTSELEEESNQFKRTENSATYLERWDSVALKDARDFTRGIKKIRQDLSNKKMLEKIDGDQNLERSVITVFNFWQDIYLSIVHDRVNEDILRRSFAGVYTDMYERFKPWIEATKSESPRATEDYMSLYEMWRPDR